MRADFRCSESVEGERFAWEQQTRRNAVRAPPAQLPASRSSCVAMAAGTEVSLIVEPDPARSLTAGLADDAARPGGPARGGARRDRAGADVSQPRRDSKWWGWGDPGESARARRGRRSGDPARADRRAAAAAARGRSWATSSFPPPQPLPSALIEAVGEENVFTGDEDRLRHATGCGYVDLARLRSGQLDAAPDAVVLPADAAAVQTRSRRSARRRASPSSPSAAAPASSAGSSRCAARTTA